MRVVSKKLSQIFFTVVISIFFLIFFACTQIGNNPTGSVTFKLNAARAIVPDDTDAFIDIELRGGHNDSIKNLTFTTDTAITQTFSNVPVGANVYAYAQVYVMYEDQKAVLYSGKSDSKIIKESGNTFELKLSVAYNSVVETERTYIVLKPLFTKEHNNQTLSSNNLEFKLEDNDETFS